MEKSQKASSMNCNELMVEFEKSLGPEIRGKLKFDLIYFLLCLFDIYEFLST